MQKEREKPWSTTARQRFRRALLAWFARSARDLPWRRTRDAYRVWVSEIMLQQTQVATVVPYYQRFLAGFPDVRSLAAAPLDHVLRVWEGLGYYRRARQMHQAANTIVERHDGDFPSDIESLRKLPGIGRYTAGAILSLAFGQPAPIVEANTQRLYSRLLALRGDPSTSAAQQRLWKFATDILPRRSPTVGTVNQALMELGSIVCTPRAPRCDRCPVARHCAAFAHGISEQIPPKKPSKRYEDVREAAAVVRHRGKVLLVRRRAGERWAGLWEFPRKQVSTKDEASAELAEWLRKSFGLRTTTWRPLSTLKHGVTRFRITLHGFTCRTASRATSFVDAETAWTPVASLADYPLSATGRRLAQLLQKSTP